MSLDIDVKTVKSGFWHMPKIFYAVLFIEFCERFAFYGIQSIAVIYFIKRFAISEANSEVLFGSFSALLYALLTVGGIIGDKWLGLRRIYFLGILFLIAGYSMLSFTSTTTMLYLSMGVILVGNIFFKTNATNYVGRSFESNDPRLDSAFTYFYMSINIGGLASTIIVPIASVTFSYTIGILLCAASMIIGLIAYFYFLKRFKSADNQVGKNSTHKWKTLVVTIVAGVMSTFLFGYLLRNLNLSQYILYFIAIITVIIYLLMTRKLNHYEAKGMYIALILMLQGTFFYIIYIQPATSMTLFSLHNVRLMFLGYQVPAGVTQSINGLFIFLFSPLLANFYIHLSKQNINYSLPAKFVTGILSAGFGFVILGFSAQFTADSHAQISVFWIFLGYGFYALGELLVGALGLSMVAQLLPKRFGGFAQGMWFLAIAIGMRIGSQLSAFASENNTSNTDNFVILHSYMKLFYELGLTTMVVGIILLFTVQPMSKAMKQVIEHRY